MMENSKDLLNAYKTSQNSAGSAMREQNAYMQSLAGTINRLKENLAGMWTQVIQGSSFTTFINSLNLGVSALRKLINVFGALPTTVGVATGLLYGFNKQFRDTIKQSKGLGTLLTKIRNKSEVFSLNLGDKLNINGLKAKINDLKTTSGGLINVFKTNGVRGVVSFTRSLTTMEAQLIASKIAMTGLKFATIALEGALTIGVGMALSFVISKVVDFVTHIVNAKQELADFNNKAIQDINGIKQNTASAEKTYNDIKNTQSELARTTDVEKRNQLMKQLTDKQAEMANLLKNTANGYDKEGRLIANNNKLIENEIYLEKQKALVKQKELFQKNNINDEINKMKEYKTNAENLSESLKKIESNKMGDRSGMLKDLTEANKKLNDTKTTLNSLYMQIQDLRNQGKSDSQIAIEFCI